MIVQQEWKLMVQRTIVKLEQALDEMQKTWEGIGCTKETRMMYYEQAHNDFKDLANKIVAESQTKKQQLLNDIKEEQTSALCKELHLDMPKICEQVDPNTEHILQQNL